MDHYTVGKIVDQVSDVLWSKLSSKHLAFPDHDRILDITVKFREDGIFQILSAAKTESTFPLNALQKLGHCFTITIFFP